VCREDHGSVCATGRGEETVTLPPGATDASLTPHHVDRGKLFVAERFGGHRLIDVVTIQRNIEDTRFPLPGEQDAKDVSSYAGLVRAADLIGQLGDPRYLKKIPALFYEFVETGVAERLGYRHAGDLRANYPSFYWGTVAPYLNEALHHLSLTQQGQQIRAGLFANVFMVEHEQARREAL
jgi:hypothetical protein